MAIAGISTGVRFKPAIYRSTQDTINQGLDPSATPPSGVVVRTAQLVAWVTAKFVPYGPLTYAPGSQGTEILMFILDETPIMLSLESMDGKTQNQVTAMWGAALAGYKASIEPAVDALLASEYGVQSTLPILFT